MVEDTGQKDVRVAVSYRLKRARRRKAAPGRPIVINGLNLSFSVKCPFCQVEMSFADIIDHVQAHHPECLRKTGDTPTKG